MLTFLASALALASTAAAVTYNCPGYGGDMKCRAEQSDSYCKAYQNPPVCFGTDTPCGCGSCPTGDDECREHYGSTSYCKFWLDKPVCQGSDAPCGCEHRRVLSSYEDEKPYDYDNKNENSYDYDKKHYYDNKDDNSYDYDKKHYYDNEDEKPYDYDKTHYYASKDENSYDYNKKHDYDNKDKDHDKSGHWESKPSYGDCNIGDNWCKTQTKNDSSYCKYWLASPVCDGGDQTCSCKHRVRLLSSDGDKKSYHGEDSKGDYEDESERRKYGECYYGDNWCKARTNYENSYCKFWSSQPTCYGDDSMKCGCKPQPRDCQLEDERCASYSSGSYCMYWNDKPTCHGTDEPCGCKPHW